jgi:cytochrome c oxidase subunit I
MAGTEEMSAPKETRGPAGFWRSYVFSTDHKVVGIQYFCLGLVAVLVGVLLSAVMRFHLAYPEARLWLFDVMTPEQYLSLMTMHGTIMVFFVLTVVPQAAFGNYFLPLQIGAREMAFPRWNAFSFWMTAASFVVLLAAFVVPGGAPLSGWTAYPPLSAVGSIAGPGEGLGQTVWLAAIGLFCVASLAGAVNFVATAFEMRAPGMRWMRMPLTCWGWVITAVLGILGFGVLLAGASMLLCDRLAGTSFFLPAGLLINDQALARQGGSPLLWQHLFWFFGHPEVYMAILPVMGVVSQVLATFSRKPVFGYRGMVFASGSIAFLGFLVWGHHMFMSGMSPYSSIAFSVLTMTIGVPSAIKTFNWLATLWGGRIRFDTAMLFALAFVSLFVSGGLTGLFLAQPALDLYFHDTYFVVAHFHMIMGVATVFGIFAATYYWFPKATGRMLGERLGKVHFYLTFVGVYAIFIPMHFLGFAGAPRRYPDFGSFEFLGTLMPLQKFISHAAFFTAAVQLLFPANLAWSARRGARAPANPWNATTLEWAVTSPPPPDNFGAEPPVVYRGAYEYSAPGAERDFTMQNEPPEADRAA